jgi:hypothetical protein
VVVEEFQSLGQEIGDPWDTSRGRDFSSFRKVGTLEKAADYVWMALKKKICTSRA